MASGHLISNETRDEIDMYPWQSIRRLTAQGLMQYAVDGGQTGIIDTI